MHTNHPVESEAAAGFRQPAERPLVQESAGKILVKSNGLVIRSKAGMLLAKLSSNEKWRRVILRETEATPSAGSVQVENAGLLYWHDCDAGQWCFVHGRTSRDNPEQWTRQYLTVKDGTVVQHSVQPAVKTIGLKQHIGTVCAVGVFAATLGAWLAYING